MLPGYNGSMTLACNNNKFSLNAGSFPQQCRVRRERERGRKRERGREHRLKKSDRGAKQQRETERCRGATPYTIALAKKERERESGKAACVLDPIVFYRDRLQPGHLSHPHKAQHKQGPYGGRRSDSSRKTWRRRRGERERESYSVLLLDSHSASLLWNRYDRGADSQTVIYQYLSSFVQLIWMLVQGSLVHSQSLRPWSGQPSEQRWTPDIVVLSMFFHHAGDHDARRC